MILIGGIRPYRTVLATMTLVCGHCQNAAAHRLTEQVDRLTLFFIPTAKVKTAFEVECVFCGAVNPMAREEAQGLQARANRPGVSPGTVLGRLNPGRRSAPRG